MSVTLTLTDNPTDGAITVATAGMPVPVTALSAPTGIVQRSGDGGITWKTVRGLVDAAIDGSGNLATVDDHEFRTGALNTYRVGTTQRVIDQFGRTVAGSWGTPTSGAAWSGADAQLSVGSSRGVATHAAANTTYTVLTAATDIADGRFEVSATVSAASITGASAYTTVYARYVDSSNFYRARVEWATTGVLTLTVASVKAGVTTTLVTTVLGFTHSGSATTLRLIVETEGNGLSVTVYSLAGAPPATPTYTDTVPSSNRIASGAWGISSTRLTSNSNANLETRWTDVWFDGDEEPYFALDSDTLTTDVAGFWLKSVMRSFLNMKPMVVDYDPPTRVGRGDAQPVIGRSLPIAQTELASGRLTSLTFRTANAQASAVLEYMLASGDIMYLQTPSDCEIPSGHYRLAGQVGRVRVTARSDKQLFTVPLQECAAPGPDVVTASSTWETVIAMFGTWEDLIAACPTWEDVLALVGDPSEVIVE